MVTPPAKPYKLFFTDNGQRIKFENLNVNNTFLIHIMGYKNGIVTLDKYIKTNNSMEYWIQQNYPIYEPYREYKLQFDYVEIQISDNVGWVNSNNNGNNLRFSYVPINPYEQFMFYNMLIIIIALVIVVIIMKRILGHKKKYNEEYLEE